MTQLEIRHAAPAEADAVLRILNDAASWLAARGIAGWQADQWKRASVDAAIERGETYLAFDGGTPVGTLNLQWADLVFWPDAHDDAGYLHRLAVGRDAHGRAIGRELLAFAERTARAEGKRFLRLDCACESAALRSYYLAAGFTWKGDRAIAGTSRSWCGALFEKAL